MICNSIVSPIQFDVTPKPLLVRKDNYVEREEYDIQYDHNNDCITVTKTEVLVRRQSSSSDSSNVSTFATGWQTIKEVYFKPEEPDIIQESIDEGVYEEVTHNTTSINEEEEEEYQNQKSLPSMDVSSLVSMISLTLIDYLSWTNLFKLLVVLFCINGLLLQIILLTIQYFSYDTSIDLQIISDEELAQNSLTICLPFDDEVVRTSSEENTTSLVRHKVIKLSDIFRKKEKISCLLPTNVCENAVKSIDNSFKCLTFLFDSEIQLSMNLSHSSDHNSYRISIHSTKTLSNSFENEFKTLLFDKSYELMFWSFRTKQLSLPYTPCHTYHKSWTRSLCLHNCFVKSVKTFCPNCVPKHVFILESDFNQSMKFCSKHECNEDYQSFYKECQYNCPQDCNHEIYLSSIDSIQESNSKLSLITRKTTTLSTSGDLQFRQKPLLTLELYFASLGGLSVLWLLVFLFLFTLIYFMQKIIEIFSFEI